MAKVNVNATRALQTACAYSEYTLYQKRQRKQRRLPCGLTFPSHRPWLPLVALNMMTMCYSESKAHNKAVCICCQRSVNQHYAKSMGHVVLSSGEAYTHSIYYQLAAYISSNRTSNYMNLPTSHVDIAVMCAES